MIPHETDAAAVLEQLGTSRQGLSRSDAARRLSEHGPNELVEQKKRTVFRMLLDQFTDFMIIVLIAAAVIAGVIGEPSDTIAIVVIVVLNAALGFSQEYRAEKAMAALKRMAAGSATVIRDGQETAVPAAEVVPGDIVVLEAGTSVPADVRLLETAPFQVDESPLTGESVPVEKHPEALAGGDVPLGDRTNMAYKGTFATYGRAVAVVTATGMDSELGRIATMLQREEEVKTPLQKRLATFGKRLALVVLAICAIVFLMGLLRQKEPLHMLLTAISLAVAAIPEALPAVVTISLALGARKMVRKEALIRKLPAVETLGSVTYICSDKTGTLTQNRMTVERYWCAGAEGPATDLADQAADGSPRDLLLVAMAVSQDARLDAEGNVMGDPTEAALFNLARQSGREKDATEQAWARVGEIPFDSERKLMTTFHRSPEGRVLALTKGAVEHIMTRSTGAMGPDGEPADLAPEEIERITEAMAAEGLRTLAFAVRTWDDVPEDLSSESAETGLTLLGLVGMMDPPRSEAAESVETAKTAGIKPVMVTGDHPLTARAIARRVGILSDDHPEEEVLTGSELAELPLEEFEKRVEYVRVYARVAPEQKLKIVKALQDRGQYVAMTGDGVNDAPALKRADIGVAMGVTGTDVSKEAAHMILLDDNFATIVRAVKEGRRIFDNIRKFINYTMASNSGEIWTIFLAPFFGLPIPLLPIHILWINLVTDGLPGLALAAEPAEKNVMRRPPRHPKESIFAGGLGMHIIWVGLLMGALCIVTQTIGIAAGGIDDEGHWRTMVFTVLCLSQMGNVLAVRSEHESLFSQGLLSNKPLLGAFALTFALQMMTIYVPAMNSIFKTAPLNAAELAIALGMSSVVFIAVEIEKAFIRRRMAA